MKMIARLGDCVIELDDSGSKEPASMRWQDQFDRIVVMLHELQTAVIALHAAKEETE